MWHQFSVVAPESDAEALADLLLSLGALSVSYEDAGDSPIFEPQPGETPIWETTQVTGLFEQGADIGRIRTLIETQWRGTEGPEYTVTALEDQPWERCWLQHFRPMRFGQRLWVSPSGFAPPAETAVILTLDPGLAFGTGAHPTTALCLEWLERQDLEDKTVVDYGCGSGILAIAALLLGAREAHAVDIDPQALTASRENALQNGIGDRLVCVAPDELPRRHWDVVVANILANPLRELADQIGGRVRSGGWIALSGILKSQVEAVRADYERLDFRFEPTVFREDWALLSGRKRGV